MRLPAVLRSLLSLHPVALASYDYWRLRRRIGGRLILNAISAVKLWSLGKTENSQL
jgi:hypothetical protein